MITIQDPSGPQGPHFEWSADGGPAFPVAGGNFQFKGMTLRDWFAGQALGACPPFSETGDVGSAEDAAKFAYEVADAMLRARDNRST